MEKEIKVFDPRFGWGIVSYFDTSDEYPIGVTFAGVNNAVTYTNKGASFLNNEPVLSFMDYTGILPAKWVTLEKIQERIRPKLIEGKLYKVWNDNWEEGCYAVAKCKNAEPKRFTIIDSHGDIYNNWEELPEEDYKS